VEHIEQNDYSEQLSPWPTSPHGEGHNLEDWDQPSIELFCNALVDRIVHLRSIDDARNLVNEAHLATNIPKSQINICFMQLINALNEQ
jgi:hypothetical protein